MEFDLETLFKVVFCLIFLACALTDFWLLRIPNALVAALAVLFVAAALLWPDRIRWLQHVTVAAVVFALGAGLFYWGKFGGGDVKLLTVATLWTGMAALPSFLIMLGIAAIILVLLYQRARMPMQAAAMYIEGATGGRVAAPRSLDVATHIPYGIVIAAAALFAVKEVPFFS